MVERCISADIDSGRGDCRDRIFSRFGPDNVAHPCAMWVCVQAYQLTYLGALFQGEAWAYELMRT